MGSARRPLYIDLQYGDPTLPRAIPANLALLYYPDQLRDAYVQERVADYRQWRGETWEKQKVDAAVHIDKPWMDVHEWMKRFPDKRAYIEKYEREDEAKFREEVTQAELVRELGYAVFYKRDDILRTRLPDLPARLYSQQEKMALLAKAKTALEISGERNFVAKLYYLEKMCQLLALPENHILVASGQYVEKPVNIATTQEMINQAVQALTDLPRYTAYAKTIQEQDGRQEVWKGRITTSTPPAKVNNLDIEDQITQITREKCCKPRSEIAREIMGRRLQWRSTGGGDDAPPSRIM